MAQSDTGSPRFNFRPLLGSGGIDYQGFMERPYSLTIREGEVGRSIRRIGQGGVTDIRAPILTEMKWLTDMLTYFSRKRENTQEQNAKAEEHSRLLAMSKRILHDLENERIVNIKKAIRPNDKL